MLQKPAFAVTAIACLTCAAQANAQDAPAVKTANAPADAAGGGGPQPAAMSLNEPAITSRSAQSTSSRTRICREPDYATIP